MVVIGIGCQSAATVAEVKDVILEAQKRAGLPCNLVASVIRGAPDAVIRASAKSVDLPARFLSASDLATRASDCTIQSQASMRAHGVPSVAEAAALAGAGPSSRLIVPRFQHARVTAAVAAPPDNNFREIKE